VSEVRQGDRIVVGLGLNPGQRRVNPIILEDLLPAGFEIETVLNPADGAGTGETGVDGAYAWLGRIAQPNVAEARDDRFVAAIDLRSDPVLLAYVVRAVTPGDFAFPAAQAEDMYRPDVFARTGAGRVQISAPGAAQ